MTERACTRIVVATVSGLMLLILLEQWLDLAP
jgi:hypothetical protein